MSYTNQTPNYNLPQYSADDKPTYLGDFNQAMSTIDTAIKGVDTKATSANTLAENANSTASSALSTAQSASTTANQANTKAETADTKATNAQTTANNAQETAESASTLANSASTTANTAKSTADTAKSTADTAKSTADNLNTQLDWLKFGNVATAPTAGSSSTGITANYNPKLKLLNLYGYMHLSPALSDGAVVGKLPESFPAPSSDRTLNFLGSGTNTDQTTDGAPLYIDTDRNIRVITDGKQRQYQSISAIICTADWIDE